MTSAADLAAILAERALGEIPLDLLAQTFGKQSLFENEKAGVVGLHLGNFSILFDLTETRRVCSNPAVIILPQSLSDAPSGLRDLYLAMGENFVSHNLGGRLSTISPRLEKTGQIVFTFEKVPD